MELSSHLLLSHLISFISSRLISFLLISLCSNPSIHPSVRPSCLPFGLLWCYNAQVEALPQEEQELLQSKRGADPLRIGYNHSRVSTVDMLYMAYMYSEAQ